MKKTNEEGIENLVYYGSGTAIRPDSLWVALLCAGIFSLIGFGYGILLGGRCLVLGLLMVTLTAAYAVLSAVLKRKLKPSLKNDILCNCAASVFSAVSFFLFGLLFFIMSDPTLLHYLVLAATYLLAFALYFLFAVKAIWKGSSSKRGSRTNKAAAYSVLGYVVGSVVARAFLPDVGQNTALFVAYSCSFLVSIIFSWGFINIPKYYLCVKYSVPDIVYEPKKKARNASKKAASKDGIDAQAE